MKSLKEMIEEIKAASGKLKESYPNYGSRVNWEIENMTVEEMRPFETAGEKMEYKTFKGGCMCLYISLGDLGCIFIYSKPVKVKVTTEILEEEPVTEK